MSPRLQRGDTLPKTFQLPLYGKRRGILCPGYHYILMIRGVYTGGTGMGDETINKRKGRQE